MKSSSKQSKRQDKRGWNFQTTHSISNNLDRIVLVFVFLYFSIDMLQRGFDRFEIVRLQFFYLNLVNILISALYLSDLRISRSR